MLNDCIDMTEELLKLKIKISLVCYEIYFLFYAIWTVYIKLFTLINLCHIIIFRLTLTALRSEQWPTIYHISLSSSSIKFIICVILGTSRWMHFRKVSSWKQTTYNNCKNRYSSLYSYYFSSYFLLIFFVNLFLFK